MKFKIIIELPDDPDIDADGVKDSLEEMIGETLEEAGGSILFVIAEP